MSNLIRINNKLMTKNNKLLTAAAYVPPGPPVDPYNPLGLPANTVRVRTSDGQVPYYVSSFTTYETATLVPGTTDIYDVYKSGTDFTGLLKYSVNVTEVLGANTTGITSMDTMFAECSSLASVPLFDTSSVTNMRSMFTVCSSLTSVPLFDTSSVTNMLQMLYNCSSLTAIPLFNTSSVTNMGSMCWHCINVQSGALALYQQASTQTNVPSHNDITFLDCGSNTTTGAAELAQIPVSWGGTLE